MENKAQLITRSWHKEENTFKEECAEMEAKIWKRKHEGAHPKMARN